jgi:hypothetical protein
MGPNAGYLTGGWGFVEAAYCLTACALLGYLTSVILRLRAQARESRVAQAAAELESSGPVQHREAAGVYP